MEVMVDMSYDPGSKLHKLWKQQQKKTKLLISLSVMGLVLFIGVASALPLKDLVLSLLFPKPLSLASQRFGNSEVSPYPLDFGIISQSQPTITKELVIKNLGSTPSALPTPDWGYSNKEGRALSFNGQDSYVDLGTPQALEALLVSDFTISLWINPTPKANQNSVILARGDSFSSQQNKFILIYLDQGKLTASLRGDNGEKNSTSISSPATIPSNSWTNITLVRRRAVLGVSQTVLGVGTTNPLGIGTTSPTGIGSTAPVVPSPSPSTTLGTSPSPTSLPTSPISTPLPTPTLSPSPTPTSELVLYINGKEEGRVKDNSGSITFLKDKGQRPLSLGSAFLGSSNTPSYQGLMDDLVIFKQVLSLEEITSLSNPSLPTSLPDSLTSSLTSSLLGYFKFDEGKGEILTDSSSFGNQGQVKGSSSFTDGRLTIPAPIAFNSNSTPNSTPPYLRMDSHPALDKMLKDSFTISGWAKYQGSGNKILVGKGDTYAGEQNKFILLYLDQEGKLVASLRGDQGEKNTTSVYGKTPIKAGEWFHYSLVRQKNVSLTLYLNGLADSDSIPDQAGDLTFTKDRPFTLGAANVGSSTGVTSSLFQGLMDDIRVYNQALTLNQIKDLYQQKVSLSSQSTYPQLPNLPHPQPLPPTPSSYSLSLKTPTPSFSLDISPNIFTLPPTQPQTITLTLKPDLNTLKEGLYSNELILNIDNQNYSIPLSFNYSIPVLNKLGIGGKAIPSPSPTPQPEEVIKDLTNQLLRGGRQPGQLGALSEEVKAQTLQSVASQRKEVMLGLAESNPKQFLKYALPKAVRERFPQNTQSFFELEATVSGTLTITHVDDFDNPQNSKLLYRVETSDNRSYNLHFTEPPSELTPNSRVTVKGFTINSEMVVDPQQFSQEPVIKAQGGALSTVGEQRVLVILANFQNNTSQPVTQDFVRSLMFTGSSSVDGFYRGASRDRTWLTGDVVGWYTIPYTNADCIANYLAWGRAAEAAASASGVNINNYQRKVYVLPQIPDCEGGFGVFGGGAWIFRVDSPYVYAHELGHVLELPHANRYRCGNKQVDIDYNCQSQEYGDRTDVMGTVVRYFNAPYRKALGWLEMGNIQNATASGTYTIERLGRSGSAPQVLRVKRWGIGYRPNEFYYVSLRDPVGFDATLDPTFTRGTSIHLRDESESLARSNIIDIVPSTLSLEALEDGGIFRDQEANLTITQISHDENSATLRVEFGSGRSCIRQNPQVTVIPYVPSSFLPSYSPGDEMLYKVDVLNNDTRFCEGSTTFNLTDLYPNGWRVRDFSGAMTLLPQTSGRRTPDIRIPSTEDGIYDVSFTVTNRDNPAYSTTATKSIIVLSQPISFTISLRVKIPGIGAGDVNTNPVRRTRTAQVVVLDMAYQPVRRVSTNLTLNGDYFVGNVPIQNVPGGHGGYFFTAKLDNNLTKRINRSPVDVVSGGTVVLPAITLVMGNVDNDEVISIQDFTQLRPCFFKNTSSPEWSTCQASDFNDDGRISVTDYSRLITNFGRRGE